MLTLQCRCNGNRIEIARQGLDGGIDATVAHVETDLHMYEANTTSIHGDMHPNPGLGEIRKGLKLT